MKNYTDVQEYMAALKKAVAHKDKKTILALYESDKIIWDDIHPSIAEEHDELVDQANAICYGY